MTFILGVNDRVQNISRIGSTMSDMDPYRVLGIDSGASDAEIKRAYRRLARKYHPDRNPGDSAAEERFKSIQAAFDSIGTSEKRQQHDEQQRFRSMGFDSGGIGMEEILRQMMGNTQFPSNSQSRKSKGIDIELGIDIDVEIAENGGKIPFELSRLRRCRRCEGRSSNSGLRCAVCGGRGVERRESTVTVNIPKGVEQGHKLRLRKMGNEHPTGIPGDLTLIVRIDPGEDRRWESNRLIQTVAVPYTTFLLGGEVKLTTPTGRKIRLSIDAGSLPGDRRRIPGEGIGGSPFDIELVLSEPGPLSAEMNKALQNLRDLGL
ncbi:MAG: hypothetical protein CMB31_01060 [Euryarchaeota archaeon]|nr:hypothetical protein [Euryarchaeota archaeon]